MISIDAHLDFRDEYMAHIDDHVCPAGVCKMEPREAAVAAGEVAR